jgi:hypothetical protein
MNIDRILAGLGDDDDVPQSPSPSGFVRMDEHFVAADFALETESTAPAFTKRDSRGRRWLGKSWSQPGQ